MTATTLHCFFTRIPDVDAPRHETLLGTLSADSRQRLQTMRDRRRAEFVTGRWLLRRAAACLLEGNESDPLPPVTERGTGLPAVPALDDAGRGYSLSHSGDLAAVAVSDSGPVGIDIEQMKSVRDIDGLLRETASAGDQARYQSAADEAARRSVFYGYWTRKEALIKLRHAGIGSVRLRRLESLPGWSADAIGAAGAQLDCLACTWTIGDCAVSVAAMEPFTQSETWLDEDDVSVDAAPPQRQRWTMMSAPST